MSHSQPLPELDDLRSLSARLGRDIRRTQGAGGNTSVKLNDVLWIKASGTWLADAKDKDIFVPVALPALVDAFSRNDPRAEKATDFVLAADSQSGLRPSIETSVHAVIDHRVVLHIHCVETIALAVREDGREEIAKRLNGFGDIDWVFVPYRRPGVPLAHAILEAGGATANVHILANHGLVVCGHTVEEAEQRLERVIAALAVEPRVTNAEDGDDPVAGPYRRHPDKAVLSLAFDPHSLTYAALGPMYPDHVIFLGDRIAVCEGDDTLEAAIRHGDDPPLLLIAPQRGVFVHERVTPGGEVMVRCLAEICARIPQGAPVRTLSPDEIYALTHWEAEHYRQSLNTESDR